jgi:hypothetical protein
MIEKELFMNAEVSLSKNEIYDIGNATQLFISIIVGYTDPGHSIISLGNKIVLSGSDLIQSLIEDNGAVLRDKFLKVRTEVKDEDPNANETEITIKLAGGKNEQEYIYHLTTEDEGYALYNINFYLKG